MRVGLFGGSFDPIHNGHLILADAAIWTLSLDRLVLVPTALPPHKPDRPVASIGDRVDMVRSATKGDARIHLADWESEGAIAYTVDTLRRLRRDAGAEAELFLVVGADSLRDFPTWRDPEVIRSLATLAVYARPGVSPPADEVPYRRLQGPLVEISSTDVRSRVAAGRSVRGFVPESVDALIRERGLYGA